MPDPAAMPYRMCVAVMLFNAQGHVWLGRRVPKWDGGRLGMPWQCPQGGIDPGEDPRDAAHRELLEEIGSDNVKCLAESRDWYSYDLPAEALGVALGGTYRGQMQKWFAMRYLGAESEINLIPPPPHKQEFDAWRWTPLDEVPALVVDFKRHVYAAVIEEFRPLITSQPAPAAARSADGA